MGAFVQAASEVRNKRALARELHRVRLGGQRNSRPPSCSGSRLQRRLPSQVVSSGCLRLSPSQTLHGGRPCCQKPGSMRQSRCAWGFGAVECVRNGAMPGWRGMGLADPVRSVVN